MADAASLHIKNTTDKSFLADVIEASKIQPVIVDFWAPWCGPCVQLGPMIERLVEARKGAVKLVKINVDENPAYYGQLGLRSIPAVIAFEDGRPVDAFMGAVPESQIVSFLDRLISGTDAAQIIADALAQAEAASQAGDITTAAQIYAAVLQEDPENVTALAGLARCYLAAGDKEQALATLALVPEAKKHDTAVKGVRMAIEMMADPVAPDAFDTLLTQVTADPGNHAVRFELAEAYAAAGRFNDSVDHLLIILAAKMDWEDSKAKQAAAALRR
jgi:putative thioredoxin